MNAITQSEIFALISEINAFADNSETLMVLDLASTLLLARLNTKL